ncbi:glycosyltransferase [Bacteroides sp. GD17]|jgi:glycosyltransferase involved in cell wall biosynthesis|uniref:glycosyltransferase n=1 Tax=Bacteroides sp. GD17 TaxID=3139826 RepID=UPI0025E6C551|nr:glycosyltransferase [uncultured Bacteroides sp.]
MKSILFYIARYPGYGGIENVTTLLANYLSSEKLHRVSILSCHQQAEKELLARLHTNISFFKLPNPTRVNAEENQNYYKQIIIDNHIDTIIYQDSYYPNECLLLNTPSRDSIKIICVEHSAPNSGLTTYQAFKKKPWYNFYMYAKTAYFHRLGMLKTKKRKQQLYTYCDKYVMLSPGYIPIFMKMNSLTDASKMAVIGNPISLSLLSEVPTKEKSCLFIGRFTSSKGIPHLLNIWKKIEQSPRCNEWKLVMVGDGEQRNEIEAYIRSNHLERVQLEGFKKEVAPYYQKASLFLMTSIFEGFPLTLPEAMGNGAVPMAFNSFAAIPDIIDQDVNGILIPPFDEEQFRIRLTDLMQDEDERNRLSQNALKKAQKFSQSAIWSQWDKLLEE